MSLLRVIGSKLGCGMKIVAVIFRAPGSFPSRRIEPSMIMKVLPLQQIYIIKITLLLHSVTSNML